MKKIAFLALTLALAAAPRGLRADSPKDDVHGEGDAADASGTMRTFSFFLSRKADGFAGDVRAAQTSEALGDFSLQGHVACMSVLGNKAAIGVAIDMGAGTAEGKSGFVLYVEDNAGPGPHDTPDRIGFSDFLADPSACALSDAGATDLKLGDIVVIDGNATPATSD